MKTLKTKKPCMFIGKDDNGNDAEMMPDVTCGKRCSTCPWNPEEKARRLKEGHFVSNATVMIRHYKGPEDERGQKVLVGGLRQLRFPAKTKKPAGESA